jgi:TRAP-type mannitol/chloroaromatic compound transport system permease large subunit
LTPPFGFALFYLRGVAPASVETSDMYRGVIPFIGLQLLLMLLLSIWPEIATWLPSKIYN